MEEPDDELIKHFEIVIAIEDEDRQREYLEELSQRRPEQAKQIGEAIVARHTANQLFSAFDSRADGADLSGRTASSGIAQTVDLERPGRLGRFRLEHIVGRGGMGAVYYGIDEQLSRPVAVKIPRLDLLSDEKALDNFLREARLAAQLDHPNLTHIFEVGTSGPWCYIVSQWSPYGDLDKWLLEEDGEFVPDDIASFFRQLAEGIDHCHQHGLVHLDLKPSNVMLARTEETEDASSRASGTEREIEAIPLYDLVPRISDFGLARPLDDLMANSRSSLLLGTPLYMAPEQAESRWEEIGPRTDLFAIGVMMFEFLHRKRPFEGDSVAEVLDQIRDPDQPSFPNRSLAYRPLQRICSKCLSHYPGDRYESASALAEDLQLFLEGKPLTYANTTIGNQLWQRLHKWLRRPARIVQAGYVSIAINTAVLINLFMYPVLDFIGIKLPTAGEITPYVPDLMQVAFGFHFPSIACAIFILKGSRKAFVIGAILSLFFLLSTVMIVTGQAPLIALYEGRPLASLLVHSFLAAFATVQFLFFAMASIATLNARKKNTERNG